MACQGSRKNQNDSTNESTEIDTCAMVNKCIDINKFLEKKDVFLNTIKDVAFYEDFEFDESFCLHTVLEEITKQKYNQSKIKEKNLRSLSDTLHLDSVCILFGSYNGKTYLIEKYEKQINSYLISYESDENYDHCDGFEYGYFLINKTTAKVIKINREPTISPNGKMLVTSNNYGDPEVYTTLLFYKINDNGLTLKKGYWERDLQIEEVYWATDKKIMIKAATVDDEERYFSMQVD